VEEEAGVVEVVSCATSWPACVPEFVSVVMRS